MTDACPFPKCPIHRINGVPLKPTEVPELLDDLTEEEINHVLEAFWVAAQGTQKPVEYMEYTPTISGIPQEVLVGWFVESPYGENNKDRLNGYLLPTYPQYKPFSVSVSAHETPKGSPQSAGLPHPFASGHDGEYPSGTGAKDGSGSTLYEYPHQQWILDLIESDESSVRYRSASPGSTENNNRLFGANIPKTKIPLHERSPAGPLVGGQINQYKDLFDQSGHTRLPLIMNSFSRQTLQHPRGVFMKGIPSTVTVADIAAVIRGGIIERIDFQNSQHRTCCAVYFLHPRDAIDYCNFVHSYGGVYWTKQQTFSRVEFIPEQKGGHEPVRKNVAAGIWRLGATRCLLLDKLPDKLDIPRLKEQVKAQTRNLSVEFEAVEAAGKNKVVMRMASIGTALGARSKLLSLPFYACSEMRFMPDKCSGSVAELKKQWDRARGL